jgi:altronate dehydratase
MKTTFMGYRRHDGRSGVRNYVAVVPTVLCSVSVARSIAEAMRVNVFPHRARFYECVFGTHRISGWRPS